MEIRTGTAQAASLTAGSILFGTPFENACDFLLVLARDNGQVNQPPTIIAPSLSSPPTASGFSYPANSSPNASTIDYIAFGH